MGKRKQSLKVRRGFAGSPALPVQGARAQSLVRAETTHALQYGKMSKIWNGADSVSARLGRGMVSGRSCVLSGMLVLRKVTRKPSKMMPSEVKSEREWGTATQLSGDGHSGPEAAGAEALGQELAAATWRRPVQWEGRCGHGGRGWGQIPQSRVRGVLSRGRMIWFTFFFHVYNLMIFCRVCNHHKKQLENVVITPTRNLVPIVTDFLVLCGE